MVSQQTFWIKLKYIILHALIDSYDKGVLSTTLEQQKLRAFILKWGPITLLSVVYKVWYRFYKMDQYLKQRNLYIHSPMWLPLRPNTYWQRLQTGRPYSSIPFYHLLLLPYSYGQPK